MIIGFFVGIYTLINFLLICINDQNRGIPDFLAGTVVIQEEGTN